MVSKVGNVIHFNGPPSNLRANVNIERAELERARLMRSDKPEQQKVMPTLNLIGDAQTVTTLAFSLPDDTPVGQTNAYVESERSRYKAVIEVLAKAVIRVNPSEINIDSTSSKPVTVALTVSNLGNVDQAYNLDTAITLRRSDVFAKSVAKAFRGNVNVDVNDRIINLGKNIESSDSEQLKVAAKVPAKTLKKGQSRTIKLEIQAPTNLAKDSSWTGSLGVLGTRVRIRVKAAAQTPKQAQRRSTKRRRNHESTK